MRKLLLVVLLAACSPQTAPKPASFAPDPAAVHVYWRKAPGVVGPCWAAHLHGKEDQGGGVIVGNLTVYSPEVPGPAGQSPIRARKGTGIGEWMTAVEAATGCP